MQSSVNEEYSGIGAVVCYDNGDHSSDEDFASEWQFIPRSEQDESDDDSVEIIDCETPSSMTLSSGSFSSDSESEEDYDGVNFKDFNNPVEEVIGDQERAVIPVDDVKSGNYENVREVVVSGSSYKILYAFFIGILASLVFQNIKMHGIPNYFLDILYSSKPYATDTFLSFPFPRTNVDELSSPDYSSGRADDDDLLTRLKDQIIKRRGDVDKIFEQQLNLLKHIKPWEKDAYVLNFSDVMQQSTEDMYINQLLMKTPMRVCTDNVTSQQLPIMCRDIENNDVVLYLKGDDVISIHDVVQNFLSSTEKKAHNSLEEILNVVAVSNFVDETTDFVSNHDRAGADLDNVKSHGQPEFEYLNEMPHQRVFDVPSSFAGREEAEHVGDSSANRESDDSIKKGWSDSIFTPSEDHESRKVNEGPENSFKEERFDNLFARFRESQKESKKEMKNLDKMKKWFDDIGDWFLRQGEARERLRQVRDMFRETDYKSSRNKKNCKDKRSFHQWFKKTSENLKGKLQTSFMKVKDRYKKMRSKVVNIVSDLRAKLKEKFRKL